MVDHLVNMAFSSWASGKPQLQKMIDHLVINMATFQLGQWKTSLSYVQFIIPYFLD